MRNTLNPFFAFLLTTITAASAYASPFQNGSFEINGGSGSSTATGWTLTGGPLNYLSSEGTTDEQWAAIFNPGSNFTAGAILAQTFDTVPGQIYGVSFDWGNHVANATQRLQIEVRDASTSNQLITMGSGTVMTGGGGSATILQNTDIFIITDSSGVEFEVNAPAPNAEFSAFAFTFTAQSGSTTLSFTDQSTGDIPSSDGILDNVRIVPEPTSLAFLGIGLSALVTRRHRRFGK